jgi:hypothetical protein
MTRKALGFGALIGVALLTGCVDRRFVIETDPPGAVVLRNGKTLGGPTPADDQFDFYGIYHFTIFKDGYETLQADQNVPAPWYEYIGLDFFSENLWPWTVHDVRRLRFQLQPLQLPNVQQIGAQGQALRMRAAAIQPSEEQ